MKTKHTPGPWVACGYKGIIVNSADGKTICAAPSGSTVDTIETIQANALLIAAAPELFTALWECVNIISAEANENGGCYPIINKAMDILLKARGES